MPYINDVFISYKRGAISEQWLDQIFLPLFSQYLNENLPDAPTIFVDRQDNSNGVNWDENIKYNLAHSKCMVAIIIPSYFFKRSEWCVREFMSMKYREEKLGLSPRTEPTNLIWPLMLQNIDDTPPIVHSLELKDYSDYNFVGQGFINSEGYFKFQSKLRNDCKSIISIIRKAPAWQETWDSVAWRDEIETRLNAFFRQNDQPKQNFTTW